MVETLVLRERFYKGLWRRLFRGDSREIFREYYSVINPNKNALQKKESWGKVLIKSCAAKTRHSKKFTGGKSAPSSPEIHPTNV